MPCVHYYAHKGLNANTNLHIFTLFLHICNVVLSTVHTYHTLSTHILNSNKAFYIYNQLSVYNCTLGFLIYLTGVVLMLKN